MSLYRLASYVCHGAHHVTPATGTFAFSAGDAGPTKTKMQLTPKPKQPRAKTHSFPIRNSAKRLQEALQPAWTKLCNPSGQFSQIIPRPYLRHNIFVNSRQDKFGVRSIRNSPHEETSALYLQVSIVSQALIFVTRFRSWSFVEQPRLLLMTAFVIAQLIATFLAVYADFSFANIKPIGWGWAGVIWLYSLVFYFPLDVFKFAVRYALSGKAWDNLIERKTAFTSKKDYGKEEREAQWAHAQHTLHGLHPPKTHLFNEKSSYRELSEIAEQAKRRAEVARLRELNTLKGHVESVVKLKGLDINTIQQFYTV